MPALANAKHELFAQALAKGEPASTAYVTAGYAFNEGNAIRLKGNEKVAGRVAELQSKAAERAVVTIHDIADQLDEDRKFARECDAPGPAITATMGKAKVLGLLADKIEHSGPNGGPIVLTKRERVRKLMFLLAKAKASQPTAH